MFKDAGLDALICDTYLDSHFVTFIEYKNPKKCRFLRIDADIDGALKSTESCKEDEGKDIIEAFKKHLDNKEISIKAEKFKTGKTPAIINVEEFMRRMSEMNGFYGMEETDPSKNATLVLNLTNPVISGLLTEDEEKQKLIVNQIYYLAMLSFKKLSPEELSDFLAKSTEILYNYSQK